jgi:DNA-binding MarR family transcriptional regulator
MPDHVTGGGNGGWNAGGRETGSTRLATDAWESLLRAQVVLTREFADDDVWGELSRRDYDVLYTLSKAPGGLRMTEMNERIMLTQPGISRLVTRLEQRGLLTRRPDPDDARAQRIVLTDAGLEAQQTVGRRHVRQIVRAMTRALDAEQVQHLHELCTALTEAADAARTTGTARAVESAGEAEAVGARRPAGAADSADSAGAREAIQKGPDLR